MSYEWPSDFWPNQRKGCVETVAAYEEGLRRLVLTSPTGTGKCLAPHTEVLLYTGQIVTADMVQTGDLLMGPDGRPRTVISTCRGRGQMYQVTPVKGDPIECNDAHILSLKMTNGSCHSASGADGSIINIPIQDYLQKNKTFRHCAKAYRVAVDFQERSIPLNPYFLGLWLGDGHRAGPTITTADSEVVNWLASYAVSLGMELSKTAEKKGCSNYNLRTKGWNRRNGYHRRGLNVVRNALLDLDLLHNKHIPLCYRANTRAVRLAVLAGIIDTDGYIQDSGYGITLVNPTLAWDTAFIARSLGLAAYVHPVFKTCYNNGKEGLYFTVGISGDCTDIPVRVKSKQPTKRMQKKDVLVTGIRSVEPIGTGDYCGWELDGDGLFLLGDFTVTHNSRIMVALLEWANSMAWPSILYMHRRMLLKQTAGVLDRHGVQYGIRASQYETALLRDVQLAMFQSELAAVLKRQSRELHPAKLVLIDELHAHGGSTLQEFLKQHYEQGALIVGITATPLDLEGEWDRLIIAGTNSDGRKCGALVPAYTVCPDEPDMKLIKQYKVQENGSDLTDKQNAEIIMRPGIFGRVYDHWKQLNPDAKPTILFGPDVGGSLFFAKEFWRKGVNAAHIDAKEIWWNGEFLPSDDETRARLLAATETGDVQVLCNRFVLREGLDLPHIGHAIFACLVGSLRSWLQMGGRALRAHPSTPTVCIQDHGANFRRHGSLNSDRHWELGQSGYKTTGLRIEGMRERPESEPITCPKCHTMRLSGPKCVNPECGYEYHKRSKVVVQINGTLKLVEGATFKPHYTRNMPDTERKWVAMYHRAKSEKWDATFRQAAANFVQENHYWPPNNLPFMPTDPADWFNKVRDVPRERLTKSS